VSYLNPEKRSRKATYGELRHDFAAPHCLNYGYLYARWASCRVDAAPPPSGKLSGAFVPFPKGACVRVFLIILIALSLATTANAASRRKKHVVEDYDGSSFGSGHRATHGMPLGGKLEVDPDFGLAMIDPDDVNRRIHAFNDAQRKGALPGFAAEDIGASAFYGLAATYRVTPWVGLGLGFHHLATSSEGTAHTDGATLDANFGVAANLVTAESRITVYGRAHRGFEGVVSPYLGIGFFSANETVTGTALARPIAVDASATGAVVGTNASLRYWFLPNLAGGITAGYRFARSGALTVNEQQNAGQTVGSNLLNNGSTVRVDAGSFLIGANLTWAI
jgi:hypothetical protein